MVGRYHPQKNHEQLFRVLNREEIREIKIATVLIGKNIKKIKSKIISRSKNHKFISSTRDMIFISFILCLI